jgi:hypothetical protein
VATNSFPTIADIANRYQNLVQNQREQLKDALIQPHTTEHAMNGNKFICTLLTMAWQKGANGYKPLMEALLNPIVNSANNRAALPNDGKTTIVMNATNTATAAATIPATAGTIGTSGSSGTSGVVTKTATVNNAPATNSSAATPSTPMPEIPLKSKADMKAEEQLLKQAFAIWRVHKPNAKKMMAGLTDEKIIQIAAAHKLSIPDSALPVCREFADEAMCIGWLCKLSSPELRVGFELVYDGTVHEAAFGSVSTNVVKGAKVICQYYPFLSVVMNGDVLVKSEVLL